MCSVTFPKHKFFVEKLLSCLSSLSTVNSHARLGLTLITLLALGKWCCMERYDVPIEFFQAMLADMPNALVNSVKEKRHLRPPVWREASKVLSYKDYNIRDIIDAPEKRSGVKLQCKKAYQGDKEIISEIQEKS